MTKFDTEATFVIYQNGDGEVEVCVMDEAQQREFFSTAPGNEYRIISGIPDGGVNFHELTSPHALIIRGKMPSSIHEAFSTT